MYARDPDRMDAQTRPDLEAHIEQALTRLLRYFEPRVGRRQDVAEELAQDTLASATARVTPHGTPLMAWLYGIARHKLVDYYRAEEQRRRRFGRPGDLDSIDIGPSDSLPHLDLESKQVQADIVTTLDRLTPRHRTAIVLRYFDELDVASVAGMMGLTIHATESLLARSRATFRRHYRDISGEDR